MPDRLRGVGAVLEYSFQADKGRSIGVVVIQVVAAANLTLTALWVKAADGRSALRRALRDACWIDWAGGGGLR